MRQRQKQETKRWRMRVEERGGCAAQMQSRASDGAHVVSCRADAVVGWQSAYAAADWSSMHFACRLWLAIIAVMMGGDGRKGPEAGVIDACEPARGWIAVVCFRECGVVRVSLLLLVSALCGLRSAVCCLHVGSLLCAILLSAGPTISSSHPFVSLARAPVSLHLPISSTNWPRVTSSQR